MGLVRVIHLSPAWASIQQVENGVRDGVDLRSSIGRSRLPRHDLVTSGGTAVVIVRRGGLASGGFSYMPQSDVPVHGVNHKRKWKEQERGEERLGASISAAPDGT